MIRYIYRRTRAFGVAVVLAWVTIALLPAVSFAQSCSYYLNATNGDDANSGLLPEDAVGSFEHAFRTFPTDAVVCMTAGEYFHSEDADGVQLTGTELVGKNMQFVLQSFAGATEVAFTEDELRIDIGTGRVEFVSGSARALRLGSGTINSPQIFPANTTFLHTLVLRSGVLDVSGVDFTIGASVGNPQFQRDGDPALAAPDSSRIARGTGTLTGTVAFHDAPRSLSYIGSGDRSSENEVPPLISRLLFNHTGGTLTVSRPLSFTENASIELAGAGSAQITTPISIASAAAGAVVVTGSGSLDLSGRFSPTIRSDASRLAHLNSSGRLILRDVNLEGAGGASGLAATFVNSGSGRLEAHSLQSGSEVHVTVHNEGNGSCQLGTPVSSTSIAADLLNESGGHCVIEGDTALLGEVDNNGRISIKGFVDLATRITNSGILDLQHDATISGTLQNTGDVELGRHSLTIADEGPHENVGRILSSDGIGSLLLVSSTTITGDGELPGLNSSSGTHVVSGSRVRAGVAVFSGADLTLHVDEIGESLTVEGGIGRFDVNSASALDLLAGTVVLLRDLTVGEFVQHPGSSIDLGSHMLALTGSFRRTGGTFMPGGGGLLFRGSALQSLEPGPDLVLDKILLSNTDVRLTSGPLYVGDSLVVGAGSTFSLFDFELHLNGERSVVVNEGEVSSSITGALVFAGPPGAAQVVTGSGLFSNIVIAMEDDDDRVLVQNADVRQSGILTIESGRLRVGAGSTYSLVSTRGIPFIRRNLGDGNGDGAPSGKAIDANTTDTGSFLSPDGGFNLEYFGTLDGVAETGAELISGQIVDFFIRISGTGSPAVLMLASDLSFSGALELAATAILDTGDFDLSATGSGVTHIVEGRIENSTGAFAVVGSSVSIRGKEDAPSSIENLRIASPGHVNADWIRSISGQLALTSGTLNLHLAGEAAELGSVRHILGDGGELVLSSDVGVLGDVNLSSGGLDLREYNLEMMSGTSLVVTDPAVIAPGNQGSVVFIGHGQIRSNSASVPRLRIALAEQSTLVLTGALRISESLVVESGTLDLSTYLLTLSGGEWQMLGGQMVGTGDVSIVGGVDAGLATSYTIPNLTIRSSDTQNGLSLRSLTNSSPRLIVGRRLVMESGVFNLGSLDVVVGGSGAPSTFSYERGRFAMRVGSDISDEASGELEFTDTAIELIEPLTVSNVRINGSTQFRSDSAPLLIEDQITFVSGELNNADSTRVRLANGVRIVRRGTASFRRRPIVDQSVELYYEVRGENLEGNVLETGPEIPAAGHIQSFTVDSGSNVLRLSEAADVVGTLRLDSGTLDRNGFALRVDAGATVHYDHSTAIAPAFAGGSFEAADQVRLVYSGTKNITSDDLTFPSEASVSELVVSVGQSGDEPAFFILHANRRIDNLSVAGRNAVSGADINGRTLLVQSDVHVRSGVIRSDTEAILEVGDSLVVASGAAIRDVVGVLARGHTEIAGVFDGHVLRAFGNVLVTGELGSSTNEPTADADLIVRGLPNLEFSGSGQVLRMQRADEDPTSIDDAVNRFIMTSSGAVRIEGPENRPFTLGTNNLELRSGLLETGPNDLRLPHDGPGFSREEGVISHVTGRISRHLRPVTPGTDDRETARFEFPLGSGGSEPAYRPLFISFSDDDPLDESSVVTMGHSGEFPGGLLGFPIDGGESVVLADVSAFYWTMEADPALPSSQNYTLGMLGTGLSSFSAARNLRLLRRTDGTAWDHAWSLSGSARQYDNAIVSLGEQSVPFVQIKQATDGIPSEPEIFAIGIEALHMDFARVQVANLIGKNVAVSEVLVADSVAAEGLGFGQATPYFRSEAGRRLVQLLAANGAVIVQDSLTFEAGGDYLVAAILDEGQGHPVLTLQEARAIPALEAKEDVSLAFFHGVPDSPPLSLRTRGDLETLFTGIPFADLSSDYVTISAVNTGFDVITTATSDRLFSVRSDLEGHAGETVHAFAAGHLDRLSHGASEDVGLFLSTNHGRPIRVSLQVATEEPAEIPATFALHGNYPNPFNPSTSVVFDLPEAADVSIEVFDLLGRSVIRSDSQTLAAGRKTIRIDASELPSGVYVYRVVALGANTHTGSGKMTLVK